MNPRIPFSPPLPLELSLQSLIRAIGASVHRMEGTYAAAAIRSNPTGILQFLACPRVCRHDLHWQGSPRGNEYKYLEEGRPAAAA